MNDYPAVTYRDVLDDIERPAAIQDKLDSWFRRIPPMVSCHMLGFEHQALLRIRPEDIAWARRASDHALGNLHRSVNNFAIRRNDSPWTMAAIFHDMLESIENVPPWQDFWHYLRYQRAADWADYAFAAAREHGLSHRETEDALHWRVGNFWQSALREVELVAGLRYDHDVPVKYHVLADTQFKIDAWLGNRIIVLRVPNDVPKVEVWHIIKSAGFFFHEIRVRHGRYGEPWIVEPRQIAEAARFLTQGSVNELSCTAAKI